METLVQSPVQEEEELRLLLVWEHPGDRARWAKAGAASVGFHMVVLIALSMLSGVEPHQPRPVAVVRHVTPLIAPYRGLTQTAPNKGKISKEFSANALLARPRIQIPPSLRSTTRPAAKTPGRDLTRPSPLPALPEPPKIEASQRELQPPGQMAQIPPPPQIQAEEKPKLAFETPKPASPSRGNGQLAGKPAPPGGTVGEAVRSLAHGGASGGLVVGDIGAGIGGIGEGLNLPPSPGKAASNLELLSDPKGVDFRPYLIGILSAVRRNWFAVMPESAKMGRRGRVSIQFAINRNGSVPKLVIVSGSGTDALDRAAVAGISASNPFPPLPPEFRGAQVRLQFNFLYNMPVN